MVQREVAERIAAPPGRDELPVGLRPVPRPGPDRLRGSRPPPSSPSPAVESAVIVVEPYDADDRLDPDDRGRAVAARPGRLPRAPQDDPQRPVAAAAGRRRTGRRRRSRPPGIDPGPAAADARGGGVAARCARRSGRSARTGAAGAAASRRTGIDRRDRPAPTPLAGRPPRPGEAQPDARGHRAARRRLPHAPLGLRAAGAGRPAQPRAGGGRPATRSTSPASTPGRPPTTSSCGRSRRRARAVGGGWPGGPGPAPALAARLEKRIPVAAGLAGGARDAAAAARRRARGVGRRARRATRQAVAAARLGSDVPFFLAGGPALVEGRGERVAPLHGLHGSAGGPARHAGRRRPDARTSSRPSMRSARTATAPSGMSSAHLAEELRAGLTAADLVARAGVLASANDLLPATVARRPGARAVPAGAEPAARAAGRAVGLRADALGALSFGERRPRRPPRSSATALRDGRRSPPRATAEPFVAATHDRRATASRRRERMTRHAISTTGAPGRHRAVQPGRSSPTTSCSAPARSRLDPATGALVEGGIEAQTERVLANLERGPRRGRLHLGRRRQDDDLPRRHGRLRGGQRDLRPVRRAIRRRPARRSASPRCRRAPGSRSRSSPASVDTLDEPPLRCPDPLMTADTLAPGPDRVGSDHRSATRRPTAPPLVNPPSPAPTPARSPSSSRPASARGCGRACPRSSTRCAAGRCSPTSSTLGDAPRRRGRRPAGRRLLAGGRGGRRGRRRARRRSRSRTSRAGTGDAVAAALAAVPDDGDRDPRPVGRRAAGDRRRPRRGPRGAPRRTTPRSRSPASTPPTRPSSAGSSAASSGPSSGSSRRKRRHAPTSSPATRSTPACTPSTPPGCAAGSARSTPSPATGELYLTDLVALAREDGRLVSAVGLRGRRPVRRHQRPGRSWPRPSGACGSGSTRRHMRAGVTMRDPSTAYVDCDGRARRRTSPSSRTSSCAARRRSATGRVIGAGQPARRRDDRRGRAGSGPASSSRRRSRTSATVGPFSHLRPGHGRRRGRRGRQLRRAQEHAASARASKQHHMSYLGDAEVGERRQHRRRHDHRQLRRHAQAPRRRSATARSSASTRCSSPRSTIGDGRADRRRRGRHPRRARRASWRSASRPAIREPARRSPPTHGAEPA